MGRVGVVGAGIGGRVTVLERVVLLLGVGVCGIFIGKYRGPSSQLHHKTFTTLWIVHIQILVLLVAEFK